MVVVVGTGAVTGGTAAGVVLEEFKLGRIINWTAAQITNNTIITPTNIATLWPDFLEPTTLTFGAAVGPEIGGIGGI